MKKLLVWLLFGFANAQYIPIQSLLTIKRLPPFIAQTIDGESVSQEVLENGGVVVFFRSTCGYCLLEYPTWIKMKLLHKDLPFVMVLHKQSASSIKRFFTTHDNPFDYVIEDSSNALWESFRARSTPESFVFDKHAKLIGHQGYIRGSTAVLEEQLTRVSNALAEG